MEITHFVRFMHPWQLKVQVRCEPSGAHHSIAMTTLCTYAVFAPRCTVTRAYTTARKKLLRWLCCSCTEGFRGESSKLSLNMSYAVFAPVSADDSVSSSACSQLTWFMHPDTQLQSKCWWTKKTPPAVYAVLACEILTPCLLNATGSYSFKAFFHHNTNSFDFLFWKTIHYIKLTISDHMVQFLY